MFVPTVSVVFFGVFCSCALSFSITLDEQTPGVDDFRPLADTLSNITGTPTPLSVVDEHDIQVQTVRTYLIIGYVLLFCLVTYVCYATKKNAAKRKPIPCAD